MQFPRSSPELHAASGLARRAWRQINWAACQRRGRSLERRLVQAVTAGAWRQVQRLSYLGVHSFAARALAVKRGTENTGKQTPGGEGARGETPEQKVAAVTQIGQWREYQPPPLQRGYLPGECSPLRYAASASMGGDSGLSKGGAGRMVNDAHWAASQACQL